MTCHVRQFYLLIFPLLMPPPINHIPQHNQQLSKNISITWMCWKLQQWWVTLPKHHNPQVQCDSFEGKIKGPLWAPSAPYVAARTVTGLIWNSEGRDKRGMFRDLWHGWNGAGTDPWQHLHPVKVWCCPGHSVPNANTAPGCEGRGQSCRASSPSSASSTPAQLLHSSGRLSTASLLSSLLRQLRLCWQAARSV